MDCHKLQVVYLLLFSLRSPGKMQQRKKSNNAKKNPNQAHEQTEWKW
jgi:hypothetical protein